MKQTIIANEFRLLGKREEQVVFYDRLRTMDSEQTKHLGKTSIREQASVFSSIESAREAVMRLKEKFPFEPIWRIQEELVIVRERGLTDDSEEGPRVGFSISKEQEKQ